MTKEELLELAAAMNGLGILGCLPGSPADLAGLRYGDVVLEVNGVATSSWAAYLQATQREARVMRVRYFRGGTETSVELELADGRAPIDTGHLLTDVATKVLSMARAAELGDVSGTDEPELPN